MIDVENMVMDHIISVMASSATYSGANVTSAFVEEEAIFPTVTVRQKNNTPLRRTNTAASAENYSTIQYEITAYSSRMDASKSECLEILKICDAAMADIGFRRIHLSEPFNVSRTLTRRYARYEAVVRAPYESGNDTVFEVYRR